MTENVIPKKPVSLYSSTMIGAPEQLHAYKNDNMRKQYQSEAKAVTQYLRNVHPAQKLSAMQVNYSNTVDKLAKYMKASTIAQDQYFMRTNSRESTSSRNSSFDSSMRMRNDVFDKSRKSKDIVQQTKVRKEREFRDKYYRTMKEEIDINTRKREYYQSCSKASVAHDIIKGTAPIPKHCVFPQKATHDQILVLTGDYVSKDANVIPPVIPRPNKKWFGEEKGWVAC